MQVRQRSGESVIAIMRGGASTDAMLLNSMVELVGKLGAPNGYVARVYEHCGEVLAGVRAGHVQAVVMCSWKGWTANGPQKHKGLELLASLRGDPVGCSVPVCVLTGAPGAAVDAYGVSTEAHKLRVQRFIAPRHLANSRATCAGRFGTFAGISLSPALVALTTCSCRDGTLLARHLARRAAQERCPA
jgi:hypothetical protein